MKSLMSYLELDSETGYMKAKEMLYERLGGANDQIEEMVFALMNGPKLSEEHIKPLQYLLHSLWNWMIELEALRSLAEMETFIVCSLWHC